MKYLISIFCLLLLVSCEDLINVDLENGQSQLVIDAIIYNNSPQQRIRISRSVNYYDYESIEGVSGANVRLIDDSNLSFTFTDEGDGYYLLETDATTFDESMNFRLEVEAGDLSYYANSNVRPVPEIDSVTWRRENVFFGDQDSIWLAEFWATDLEGLGDTYWIRGTLDGELNTNTNNNRGVVSYEASFGSASQFDNTVFIVPIRAYISQVTGEDEFLEVGDEVGVFLCSISRDFGNYLEVLEEQVQNGGLFATPSANLPTNFINNDPHGEEALGWFEVCNTRTDSGVINWESSSNR